MAKEGAPHATMVEAFVRRLKQLYPEPPAAYSLGKQVTPPGLKPDIYVQHPDGRQWAFEMVHGNSNADHLLDNHARYAEASISDHWILWDDLQPKSGREFVAEQGVMPTVLGDETNYSLTKTHKAILSMQSGESRCLYVFTADAFGIDEDTLSLNFLQTLMIGAHIYQFDGWDNDDVYPAVYEYVPINNIGFRTDGSIVGENLKWDEETMNPLLSEIGIDLDQGFIPKDALQSFESMILDGTFQAKFMEVTLASLLEEAEPEELRDLQEFIESANQDEVPTFQGNLSGLTAGQTLGDPDILDKAPQDIDSVKAHIDKIGLPALMRQWILSIIEGPDVSQVADLMRWKDESEVLRQVQDKEEKQG
jgi:hypothetical protein